MPEYCSEAGRSVKRGRRAQQLQRCKREEILSSLCALALETFSKEEEEEEEARATWPSPRESMSRERENQFVSMRSFNIAEREVREGLFDWCRSSRGKLEC